jgi:uncharacterized protein DUF6493
MTLASELVAAVRAGDVDRVVREVLAATEKDRRAAAKEVEVVSARYRWRPGKEAERLAGWLASLGTATAREVLQNVQFSFDDFGHAPAAGQVLAARGQRFAETLARGILRQELWSVWPLLRQAVDTGLLERPDEPGYIVGMVRGLQVGGDPSRLDTVYRRLIAAPSLLDDVWHLFEVDAGSDLRAASVWDAARWDKSKPANPDQGKNVWEYAFVRLAAEGRLDRSRLLTASLGALQRDFRPSTVGWYAKLHEALEPTKEERLERSDLYLALLGNSAPAAVKEGLTGLREVEDALEPGELARAVAGPLSLPQKAHAVAALQLLERAAKRGDADRAALLEAAAQALAHEQADVQERALKLIERYPEEGAAVRAALLGYTEAVAPSLRPRLEAVTGIAGASPVEEIRFAPVGTWPQPRRPEPSPELVLSRVAPLAPVTDVTELIEVAAALLEGQGTGDDAERFLDGLSRLCAERPPGFERRTAALLKRAAEPAWFGFENANALISMLVRAWVGGRKPQPLRDPFYGYYVRQSAVKWLVTQAKAAFNQPKRFGVAGFVGDRVEAVSHRVAARRPLPLLAAPTHAGGWIDPDILRSRQDTRGHRDGGDRDQARARAFPEVRALEVRTELSSQRTELSRQRVVIEIERPDGLGGLADRLVETIPPKRHQWFGLGAWAGSDALGAHWSLTVLPSLPEPAFAAALIDGVAFVDGSSTYGHPEIVLAHALAPFLPLPEVGWRAIAVGLLAKSPDLQRTATDVLVQTISDGRFDAELLGRSLAWLLDAGIGTSTRLGPPLSDAGRLSPLHAAQVSRAVGSLAATLQTAPHGLHVPLGVALECAIAAGAAVDDQRVRAGLERLAASVSRGSKLGRAASGLLERPLDEAQLGQLRAQATAAAA